MRPFDEDDHTMSEGLRPLMKQGTVEMAYEEVPASSANLAAPWRAVDIVTKNTIYALDARLRCTAVIERASGERQEDHVFVGALLVGGCKRGPEGQLVAVSHPLPEVGMGAVFQGERASKRWHNETSDVIRIIIRQRVVSFKAVEEREAPWDDLTGSGPRKRKQTLHGTPEF